MGFYIPLEDYTMQPKFKILICAGASLTGALLAALSPILAAPVVALAAYMAVSWGGLYLLPVILGTAAGALLPYGADAGSLSVAVMLALIPVWIFVCEKRRLPIRYELLGIAVISCLGIYLSMTLKSMLAGQAPYAEVVSAWEDGVVASFKGYVPSGVSGYSDLMESFDRFTELIPDMLMPATILTAEAFAVAVLFLYRLWCRLFRTDPRPMADLSEWRLPHTALIGCLIMGVGIAAVLILKLQQATSIALSLGLVITSLLSVQGLAYLMFVLKVSQSPKVLRVLLWVICVMSFPYVLVFLSLIGAREQIQNRRGAMKKYLAEMHAMDKAEQEADEYAKYGYIRKDKDEKEDGDEEK